MEAVRRRQNSQAAGSNAAHLNGRFDRLSAAVRERRIAEVRRHNGQQLFGQFACRVEEPGWTRLGSPLRCTSARLRQISGGFEPNGRAP